MSVAKKEFSVSVETAQVFIEESEYLEKKREIVYVYLLENKGDYFVKTYINLNREFRRLDLSFSFNGISSSFNISFDVDDYSRLLNSLEGFTDQQNLCDIKDFIFNIVIVNGSVYLDVVLGDTFSFQHILSDDICLKVLFSKPAFCIKKHRYHFLLDGKKAYLDISNTNLSGPRNCINHRVCVLFKNVADMDSFEPSAYSLSYMANQLPYAGQQISINSFIK
jgi:hypothetical protein